MKRTAYNTSKTFKLHIPASYQLFFSEVLRILITQLNEVRRELTYHDANKESHGSKHLPVDGKRRHDVENDVQEHGTVERLLPPKVVPHEPAHYGAERNSAHLDGYDGGLQPPQLAHQVPLEQAGENYDWGLLFYYL